MIHLSKGSRRRNTRILLRVNVESMNIVACSNFEFYGTIHQTKMLPPCRVPLQSVLFRITLRCFNIEGVT